MDQNLKERIPFELFLFFRNFINPDLEEFRINQDLHKYHILFQLLEHELRFMETEMQGIVLNFVIFSARTCSNMNKFLIQMHNLDILPLVHPNGYRQVMFMDYQNIYGHGPNALYLHTSPHKQYYMFMRTSLLEWLEDHCQKLQKDQFLIQNGKISYFMNVKNVLADDPDFKNGSYTEQDGITVSAQGKFEMLQSSIYPDCYGGTCEFFFVIKIQFQADASLK